MPRRKPRSPLEEATAAHHAAFEKLISVHRGNFWKAMVEEMEADERAARAGDYQNLTREAEKATDRAYRDAMDRGYNPDLEPPDEENAVVALWQSAQTIQRLLDTHAGRKQRKAAKRSPGRRGRLEGWYFLPCGQIAGIPQYEKTKTNATPEDLLAAVATRHPEYPGRTFNDVCEEVRKYFGYESAYSVKKAAKSIQWRSKTK